MRNLKKIWENKEYRAALLIVIFLPMLCMGILVVEDLRALASRLVSISYILLLGTVIVWSWVSYFKNRGRDE